MTVNWRLAQLNVARMRAPLDDPSMAEFSGAIDRVNALADTAPGFLWRWIAPEGDDAEERVFGQGILVNVSLWESVSALRDFAYAGTHLEFLRRRREWFLPAAAGSLVLWWVPEGHLPSLEEAAARRALLVAEGATERAFDAANVFPPPQHSFSPS